MKEGFILTHGKKELFYESDCKYITDNIARKFIDKLGEVNGICKETIDRAKKDVPTLRVIKGRIDRATLELRDTGKIKFYKLTAKFMCASIPLDEADCLVIF